MAVAGCGWLWVVLGVCGWLWMVGYFRITIFQSCFCKRSTNLQLSVRKNDLIFKGCKYRYQAR